MLLLIWNKMIDLTMNLHKNQLFACLDIDLHLERIAGGNESEVYRTDDGHFVVKLKVVSSTLCNWIVASPPEVRTFFW